jgi:RNA polymerase sigma-70 factor (ECF subfamily)
LDSDERGRFERVALPHLDAAYNLARWLTRDEHGAEDVVQEAFYRAARFFAGFRGSDGRTWLLAVVRRASYDWLQKQRRWTASAPFDEDAHSPSKGDDPEVLAIRKADVDLLRRVVEDLPTEYREVIVLRELEGLSYQQIATVTEVPLGTVMSRLSRARKQLQKRLAPCSGESGED